MKAQKVKDYNKEALSRYEEAVKNWDNTKGGFPNLCFYTFNTPEGTRRLRGYVVSKDNSHNFRLTKAEVRQDFNIAV